MILEAVPRFLIRSCCISMEHCSNIRGADPPSLDTCKKVMEDLANLNSRVGEFLQADTVSMIRTGDILTGRKNCPVIHYMDALYEMWGSDKIAYSKIATGLLGKLNKNLPKRTCPTTSSLGRGHWMPLLISTREGRLRTHAASASAREAPTAAAAPAPTGSKTATATTSPEGTTRLTSTDLTGISLHFHLSRRLPFQPRPRSPPLRGARRWPPP
jgi:hypothetical protein